MIKLTRDPDLRIEDDQLYLTRGDRQFRIRGLEKNLSTLQLSVSILATRDELIYLDTVALSALADARPWATKLNAFGVG